MMEFIGASLYLARKSLPSRHWIRLHNRQPGALPSLRFKSNMVSLQVTKMPENPASARGKNMAKQL
ncbi:MAG: hypothetical protein LIV24_12120, partial [Eubacterium sp.]|nr:hypothetical protein [Eubacterium sp.]